jgi:hypothetical protein
MTKSVRVRTRSVERAAPRDILDDHNLAVSEIGNGSTGYDDEALNDMEVVAT